MFQLPLIQRKEVAEETMAFWFDIRKTDFRYLPGQNADFTLIQPPETDAEGDKRTFSVASAPNNERIMIATRMRPTAFKNSLRGVPLGTSVHVTQPSGDMTLHEETSVPAVLIAGGIGITPFRSMVEWSTHAKSGHQITLLYSNRTAATAAFLDELRAWERDNTNFRCIPTITDDAAVSWQGERGLLDAAMIRRHVEVLEVPIYYLAGPPKMVEAMWALLQSLGIPPEKIKLENFTGY